MERKSKLFSEIRQRLIFACGKIDRCEPNQEPDKKWGQTKHSFEIR